MLLKQSIYFHMALSYCTLAIQTLASTFLVLAGECVTLQCDSRPSCTAAAVCETQPRLVPPYHPLLLHILYAVM